MDFCSHCLSPLIPGKNKCPECGLSTSGEDADIILRDREERSINLQLARINLLRIRGQRKEAITICEEILKYHPENSDALAIRGDLAFDEGDLDGAGRWYRTAADASPGKLIYQQRLHDIMAEVERRDQLQEHQNTLAMLSRRTRNYRLFGILTGVGLVLALIMLSQLLKPGKSPSAVGEVAISKSTAAPQLPDSAAQPDQDSTGNTPQDSPVSDMTPEEMGMMEVVNGVLAAHTDIAIRNAHYDPVMAEATLTALTDKHTVTDETMRISILAAKAITERWNTISRVRIRVVAVPNASEKYLLFMGTVTKANAQIDTGNQTTEQLSSLFNNIYIK